MATKKKVATKKKAATPKAIATTGFMLMNPDNRFFGLAHELKNTDTSFSDAREIYRGLEMHTEPEHGHVFESKAEAQKVSNDYEQYKFAIVEVEVSENDLGKIVVTVEDLEE